MIYWFGFEWCEFKFGWIVFVVVGLYVRLLIFFFWWFFLIIFIVWIVYICIESDGEVKLWVIIVFIVFISLGVFEIVIVVIVVVIFIWFILGIIIILFFLNYLCNWYYVICKE